jgi:Domain of unknown function (DUF4337)
MEGDGEVEVQGGHKKIALLVAILAAFLAISEMGGKAAQTHALVDHIDASDLWSFFQAKSVRQTTVRTAADAVDASYADGAQPMPAGLKKQVEAWRQAAQRYETEPETGEGRKELAARAKVKEADRSRQTSAYHMFEYGSAALQLAIVLAGATALTNVMALIFVSGGLGLLGVVFGALGFLAPTLLHF